MKSNGLALDGKVFVTWQDGSIGIGQGLDFVGWFVPTPDPCGNHGDYDLPTGYKYTYSRLQYPRGEIHRAAPGPVSYSGCVNGYDFMYHVETLSPVIGDVESRAYAKFIDDLRKSDISVNTTVGEGRETLQLIKQVGVSALKAMKVLRRNPSQLSRNLRGKLREVARNPLQSAGSAVLAWNLALKPLASDVEALRNHLVGTEVGITIQAKGSAKVVTDLTDSRSDVTNAPWINRTETLTGYRRVSYGATVKVVDLHQFENWRAGLTVRPSLGWELVPLSFLVDYFFHIGRFLEAFEASILNNGFAFQHGYKTVTYRYDSETSFKGARAPVVGQSYSVDVLGNRLYGFKERIVLLALPMPAMPTFKLPQTATQLLNVAALLSNLLTRK